MSDFDFFNGFLKAYLPKTLEIKIKKYFSLIRQSSTSFLESRTHTEFEADLIYDYQSSDLFLLIHIEHQSSPDQAMSLRIANYQSAALLSHLPNAIKKNNKKENKPEIISLVYYQGQRPWNCPRPISIIGQVIFIDLPNIPDEILLTHETIGVIEILLKYVRHKSYKKKFKTYLPLLKQSSDKIRESLLKYFSFVTDFSKSEFLDLIQSCLPKDKERTMTIYEQCIEEGRKEGMEKGMEKGLKEAARRLLSLGLDESLIQKATNLSVEVILNLKKEVLH